MGGCAAPYCNNSATKKYTMKRFPRNPERQVVDKKMLTEKIRYQQTIHFFAKLIRLNFLQ